MRKVTAPDGYCFRKKEEDNYLFAKRLNLKDEVEGTGDWEQVTEQERENYFKELDAKRLAEELEEQLENQQTE